MTDRNLTGAERQQSFRERMNARGYTQLCEWIPDRDIIRYKVRAAKARKAYKNQGEPDKKKP